MIKNILLALCIALFCWQLLLLYSLITHIGVMSDMSPGNRVITYWLISIPFYIAFSAASGFLVFGIFKDLIVGKYTRAVSISLCVLGSCLMCLHIWSTAFIPLFELG